MDTPGLEDAEMRKQAAEAITMALRKNGCYQVVFVVTLESGRMRPQDVTVINLVLKSAIEIRHYGVIFNKLSNGLCKKINASNEDKAKLVAQVTLQEGDNIALPFPLFLPDIGELEDKDDVTADVPALKTFMQKLPSHDIHVQNVEKIELNKFEKYLQELEKLRQLNELMIQKEKEEKRKYEAKIEKQRKEDKIRREQELKIQEQNAERARVIMLEKERERRKQLEKLRNEEAERNAKRVAELQEQERQQIEETKRQHQEQLAQQERLRREMNERHVAEMIAANNRRRHHNECVIS